MQFSLKQLQTVLSGASVSSDALVSGLSTDSRKIKPGDLFVALRGEHFDAHDFLPQVAASGAAAVVAEHLPENFSLPALLVPDAKMALAEIGRYWRRQFSLPVIGVTGSNGKTTVKEMIAAILAAAYGEERRLATSGNLNNEIGVPMTMLRLHAGHQAAVIEMGMNHPGEIALLASVALPTVVLVNNAQREHQEFMQTVQAVAQENGAAIRALPDDGVAVFPADAAYSALWRSYANESAARKVLSFGLSGGADVQGSYQANEFGSALQIRIAAQTFALQLHAAGEHNVMNALAAAACCAAIGIDHQTIARGLEAFQPVSGRLQRKQAPNGRTVIDDTYNANPDSVRAAIDVLSQMGGDSALVLGDMGEVGDEGVQFHEEIGNYARERGVAHLLVLGELVQHAARAFGAGARHFSEIGELLSALDAELSGKTTVLVKGSRFMKMERVVAHLLATPGTNSLQQETKGNH
ncbi:MAG: UDP-N-acetylmuramoyl-tripeptide--D-alanyl-D-alanine ligase [Burkholderiales bacterium]|nr:UDP-N-acetylmuramoyl-tripeptide--D-alanyl-D-alanine ligase [Burkholderiales bacterium]